MFIQAAWIANREAVLAERINQEVEVLQNVYVRLATYARQNGFSWFDAI
jgi:hypothetical protein